MAQLSVSIVAELFCEHHGRIRGTMTVNIKKVAEEGVGTGCLGTPLIITDRAVPTDPSRPKT